MKTAGRETQNGWAKVAGNRAPGADVKNRSSSIKWAVKQEKLQPMRKCFFLTSLFIELTRQVELLGLPVIRAQYQGESRLRRLRVDYQAWRSASISWEPHKRAALFPIIGRIPR